MGVVLSLATSACLVGIKPIFAIDLQYPLLLQWRAVTSNLVFWLLLLSPVWLSAMLSLVESQVQSVRFARVLLLLFALVGWAFLQVIAAHASEQRPLVSSIALLFGIWVVSQWALVYVRRRIRQESGRVPNSE